MPSEWRGTKLDDDVAANEPEVRVPGGVRFFTLAVRMFGGDDEIIVTVKAANRAQSFTAAARKADDPNNVREVELLRDGDHELGCSPYGGVMVEEETPVPTGGAYYPDAPLSYLAARGYFAPTIDMCDGSAVWAPEGRKCLRLLRWRAAPRTWCAWFNWIPCCLALAMRMRGCLSRKRNTEDVTSSSEEMREDEPET